MGTRGRSHHRSSGRLCYARCLATSMKCITKYVCYRRHTTAKPGPIKASGYHRVWSGVPHRVSHSTTLLPSVSPPLPTSLSLPLSLYCYLYLKRIVRVTRIQYPLLSSTLVLFPLSLHGTLPESNTARPERHLAPRTSPEPV